MFLEAAGGGLLAVLGVAFVSYGVLRPLQLINRSVYLLLAMVGIRSRYVVVDGHRIHYYEGGPAATAERPPVVLVHGLGGYALQWAGLMMQLVKARRHVYALDLLGYGKSARPGDAAYSIPQEAGIVEGFLRAKQIGDYDLCGWSMGGWVSQRVALNEKQRGQGRVRRLILLHSAGLIHDPDWDTDLFVPDTPEKLHELDKLLFPKPPWLPGFLTRDVIRDAIRQGWVIRRSMDAMLTGQDVMDGKLGALKMPVLIVWGSEDHIIPLSVGERLHAEIPQSEFEVYEGCGHLAPVQCAGRIGRRMVEFLNAHPPEMGGKCDY